MPSHAVDVAWHEFILFTENYNIFCKRAFGYFLHHVPSEAMQSKNTAQAGIKRAWRLACKLESLNPNSPKRLPVLFAIDKELQIENGFYYNLNCASNLKNNVADKNVRPEYCVTDIGCSSCSSGCSASSSDSLLSGALFGSWVAASAEDSGTDSSVDSSDSGSSDSSADSSCSSSCSGGGD